MRRIELNKWEAELPDGTKQEEDLVLAIRLLVSSKNQNELPRGIEKFQIFSQIAKAFDKAEKTNVLEIEEREYEFLKSIVELDIPSTWGLNKDISDAIERFLNAKEEK